LRRTTEFQVFDNIVSCLLAGVESTCVDPRDNVFAVLSLLSSQARSLIPVDYALECGTVYTNAVLAVIISTGDLNILAKNGPHCSAMPNPQVSSSTALWLDQYTRFLHSMDHQEREDDDRLADSAIRVDRDTQFVQYRGERIWQWRAKVEFRIIDNMGIVPDLLDEHTHVPVVMCRRPPSPIHNMLPRLQVRAHFIDILNKERLNIKHAQVENRDGLLRIRPVLYRGEDGVDLVDWCKCTDMLGARSSHCDTCMTPQNLVTFIEPAAKRGYGYCVFRTSMGVGFTFPVDENSPFPDVKAGHEIWALDGATVPFVLLKTGHMKFQVMGDCWWGATLEQDYSDLGSPKVQQPSCYEKWAQVIEIH
jgi:hypothetical protein